MLRIAVGSAGYAAEAVASPAVAMAFQAELRASLQATMRVKV